MKKLKWIGVFILLCMVSCAACVKIMSVDLPQGQMGSEADDLADAMLTSLNKPAWDSLRYVKWTFFGGTHHYHWDKKDNNAIIEWKKNKVVMDLDEVNGIAMSDNVVVEGEEKQKLIDKAWNIWCNDSFWFCAPFKVYDPGVERSVVEIEGKTGLKITYASGGVTPGDSYVWWLDQNNIPESWQMWTQILPVKGIKNSWEGWIELPGGAKISTEHGGLPIKAKLSNVAGGMSLSDIGLEENAFNVK